MKRRYFIAELVDNGRTIAMSEAYAMNSAIRASEALARDYARDHSMVLNGEQPTRYGQIYTRRWVGPDVVLKAVVAEVYS